MPTWSGKDHHCKEACKSERGGYRTDIAKQSTRDILVDKKILYHTYDGVTQSL